MTSDRYRALILLGALLIMAGCTSRNEDIPTLMPTVAPSTETLTPFPKSTDVPTVTAHPTIPTVTSQVTLTTLAPVIVVTASGATSIILSAEQVNARLAQRFAANPIPTYREPPRVSFADGTLRLTLHIQPDPQPILLTLTLSALATTAGNRLDLRATGLTTLNGVTTQQVKQGQALLKTTLEDMASRAVSSSTLMFNYVSVIPAALTLTVVID